MHTLVLLARTLTLGSLLAVLVATPASDMVGRTLPVLPPAPEQAARDAYAALPLTFEANTGQHAAAIRFLARTRSGMLALTPDALTLALPAPRDAATDDPAQGGRRAERPTDPVPPPMLRFAFVGANPEASLTAEQPLPGIVNYLLGNDPAAWHTAIPTSQQVRYRGLYPGVEVTLHDAPGGWEYDVRVAPGANPDAFGFAISGAENLRVEANGELVLTTAYGEVRQRAPVAWQEAGGAREPVAARFDVRGDGTVGFAVGDYDPMLPLVIDPLVYATYLGGGGSDYGNAIALDSTGATYLAGSTNNTTFPATPGAAQATYGGGVRDAFVARLNPAGTQFTYVTYLGGNSNDYGNGIAVDGTGAAYVTGYTASTNFPVTAGAAQGTYSGGISAGNTGDAFVVKLNAAGTAFAYATYLGGSATDEGFWIAVDGTGAAYVTGYTDSTNFPVSAGAPQTTLGVFRDAFVVKFNPTGTARVYATYLGGSSADVGRGIAVDGTGAAYVAGNTVSTDFPISAGAFQITYGGGNSDGFVARLNAAGTQFTYATYLGGSLADSAYSIAVDGSGAAYVAGVTSSTNFPVIAGAAQTTYGGGNSDSFVAKLNAAGTARVYATYLGGGSDDFGTGIATDGTGAAYITGYTLSTDFPVTSGATQMVYGGNSDGFVAKLNAAGTQFTYATYLGGSLGDSASSIAVDSSGAAYVTGYTDSTNFPVTSGAAQTVYGNGRDAFVAKIATGAIAPPPPPINPLPGLRPPGGTPGSPNPLPVSPPPGTTGGPTPNPLPVPRP